MTTFNEAARAYERAKAEHAASAKRLDVAHAALVAQCAKKDEGAVTTESDAYKVTVTYSVNRTVDQAALNALWPTIPEGARRVFPVKHGIDVKELRHWMLNEPEVYGVIAQAITAKPAKAQVRVEPITESKAAA